MMRIASLAAAAFLLGCSFPTEPPVPDTVVLGTIITSERGDPQIETRVSGRAVEVRVTTYGNTCFISAGTSFSVRGLVATVTPYDHDPGCARRDLGRVVHHVVIPFGRSGTARILVRGLDRSGRTTGNPAGQVVTVERTVTLR